MIAFCASQTLRGTSSPPKAKNFGSLSGSNTSCCSGSGSDTLTTVPSVTLSEAKSKGVYLNAPAEEQE